MVSRRVATLAWLLCAPLAVAAPDEEVEEHIAALEFQVGDGPHGRERERAAGWLVEHADRSYPVVLARLKAGGGRASVPLIVLSPRFRRTATIAPLERLLGGPGSQGWEAAQALALHPQPQAGQALRKALAGRNATMAENAADALATRGDSRDCKALAAAHRQAKGRLLERVERAATELGCPAK